MGLEAFSKEEQKGLSMVDLAFELLQAEKQPLPLQDFIEQIKKSKQISEEEFEEQIARFYTNLNLDGRFMFIGENHWGLKEWYPFDQTKEDIEIPKPKRRKRKKKKPVEDDYEEAYDEDDEEAFDEDNDDYDEDDEDYEEDDDEEADEDDDYKKGD